MAKYWEHKLRHLETTLQQASHIIGRGLAEGDKSLEDVVMLEYGAGAGVFCLLGRMLGMKGVIYNDIDETITKDAQTIGRTLRLEADQYLVGDIDSLIVEMRRRHLSADLVVSYDCLEHIYDIDNFLHRLRECSTGKLSFFLASGANPMNYRIRRKLMQLQREVEIEDREPKPWDWHKDSHRSCRDIRRDLIRQHAPHLPSRDREELATRTRGMKVDDIMRAVDDFCDIGNLPDKPQHPTNTCEPLTGNFCERLMNPFDLSETLRKENLNASVEPGFYGVSSRPTLKDLLRLGLNFAISTIPVKWGLSVAPYYALVGSSGTS
jgi:hypothetical protein